MSDNAESTFNCDNLDTSRRDPVCVDVMRVYDSCGSKDCLEDLSVLLSPAGQQVVDRATSVRIKNTEILNVSVDLDPVPFHKGYYSVNITFYFGVSLDVFLNPTTLPVPVNGLAVFTKQAVMYGSEGCVKIYSSDCGIDDTPSRNLPKATVQVAEPISLSAKLAPKDECCKPCCHIPECICSRFGGEIGTTTGDQRVLVSIGVFSIVQIVRNVQMLIPAYDFCVPCKECTANNDDPCELFSKIEFPTDEFFPVGGSHCNNCD